MTDTQSLVPTDADIDAAWQESVAKHEKTADFVRDFARAVLAKWGQPQAVAVGEPVDRVFIVATGEEHEGEATYTRYDHAPPPLCDSECLYTAPQPAVAAGWVSVKDRLPEACKPVLLDIGRKYPIRALWAPKFTLPTDGDVDYGEYDEATDDYYCHEGWYEWNQNEETHWAVNETPCAWCELPKTIPLAPSTEGESNG